MLSHNPWGFRVFERGIGGGDLAKLLTGNADLLVAAIPVLLDSKHAQYASIVGPDDWTRFGETFDTLAGRLTVEAQTWAASSGARLSRRWEGTLADAQFGRIALTLFGFERPAEDA